MKAIFLNFDYIDSWLTSDESKYLHSIGYYFMNFYGIVYEGDSFKNMSRKDIDSCYSRFLVKCCDKRISLYHFATKFDKLSPNGFKLYNKEAILYFFKYFQYVYVDCSLTEPEKQYLISIGIDIRPWYLSIIRSEQFILKDLNWSKNQIKSPKDKKRSMNISSDECYEKDEEYNDNYKQENMENDIIKNEITAMKEYIENYLSELDNKIKNKIINDVFNDISETNTSKCIFIKKPNNMIKTKNELQVELHNIEENIKKYEIEENEEINDIKNIEKNMTVISFNKSESKSANKFFDNALLFNLFYRYDTKPEWMKNDTKCIIDNKKRFNNKIIYYVEYITSAEDLAEKKNIENILKECISENIKHEKC